MLHAVVLVSFAIRAIARENVIGGVDLPLFADGISSATGTAFLGDENRDVNNFVIVIVVVSCGPVLLNRADQVVVDDLVLDGVPRVGGAEGLAKAVRRAK